jgi:hypothetical protein
MRRAWEKPPSSFHRWVANHPLLWLLVVVGVIGVPSLNRALDGGVVLAAFVGVCILAAVCALIGAVLTRRRVREYDAGRPT